MMEVDKEIEAELRLYPSNFDLLEEVAQMSKDYPNKIKRKLLQEHESAPYDTDMETLRAWNLISFLCFVLGNDTEAFEYNSKVLELDKDNVVGLCNKAWFLYKKQEQYSTISVLCKHLKELLTCTVNCLVAKAEIAFCFSRFGVKRYETSRKLFKEILDDSAAEMEDVSEYAKCTHATVYSQQKRIPVETICVWTFGYALTHKRLLNINNVHDASTIDLSKRIHATVCALYSRIIGMKGHTECLARYKARSYAEIGSLVYNVRKNKNRFPNGIKDILPDNGHLWMTTETFFTTALEMCPNDVFVLERSGRYFRYMNKIEKSIELLNNAIEIRGTAFSHHHLALSLKRQLELKSQNARFSISDPERLNVSRKIPKRNLMHKFEEGVGNVSHDKFDQKERLTVGCDTEIPEPAISMTKQHRQDLPECSDQASSGDLAQDSSTEQLCDQLEQTSLDSAYGTMPFDTNLQRNKHSDYTFLKSRQVHQSTRSSQEYQRYNGNRRNTSKWRSYSSRSPFERSTSEPTAQQFRVHNRSDWRRGRSGNRTPFRREQSWAGHNTLSVRRAAINMIKSPKKPICIDKVVDGDTIEKIIFHLDKSVEMSNNCGAIYDKGLLYRQTGQKSEALATFKSLLRNEGGYCSLVQLSNSFEQAGLCLNDILGESDEENECHEYDMRMYFKKSIEISCALVSKMPFLRDCWVSAPTLQNFLSGKAKTKEYLKDLSFLFQKIANYGEAISVLKELRELAEDETEKAKINLELVENYVSKGNCDDAVLALDMIMCLPDGYTLIDENLYLRVHINGGFDVLREGDTEMARLRLRNALDFYRCNQVVDESEEDENDLDVEEMGFDVFILCNENDEDKVTRLMMAISECTLRVTINFIHLIPGALKLSGICNMMRRSKHFLLVYDKPLDKQVWYNFEMMQEIVRERRYGHTVILTATPGVVLPQNISQFPRIHMELNIDADDTATKSHMNEFSSEKIKELLFKLARGR